MQIVNWGLMKHPLNWFTVVLMVIIGGAFLHFLLEHIRNQFQAPMQ